MRPPKQEPLSTINKIEMKLSAFGVESDSFPNISAVIDLRNDTSYCDVSFYDPKYRGSIYRLTKTGMDSIRYLLAHHDIRNLREKYTVQRTDQPTSTTTFYLANEQTIEVLDYGLEGEAPLSELYRLVYKL